MLITRREFAFAVACVLTPVLPALAQGDAASPAEGEPAAGELRPVKIEGSKYRLGELSFDTKTREIWFAGRVNQDEVLLEYAVSEETRGKLHEALLSTKVTPFEIQIAMKLLRWEPSRRDIYRKFDEEGKPIGVLKDDGKGRMEILVRLRGADGGTVTEPIGNWMHNVQTQEPIGAGVWTYTGSKVIDGRFIATDDGAIAAIYRYDGAMCNSFNPGSDDDELWFPIADKVPPIGTELEIILRPLPDVEVPAGRRLEGAGGGSAKGETKDSTETETAPEAARTDNEEKP